MTGRADIEGSKSNVAMNGTLAWMPQARCPCGCNLGWVGAIGTIKSALIGLEWNMSGNSPGHRKSRKRRSHWLSFGFGRTSRKPPQTAATELPRFFVDTSSVLRLVSGALHRGEIPAAFPEIARRPGAFPETTRRPAAFPERAPRSAEIARPEVARRPGAFPEIAPGITGVHSKTMCNKAKMLLTITEPCLNPEFRQEQRKNYHAWNI